MNIREFENLPKENYQGAYVITPKDNIGIAKVGELVRYNGYIQENIDPFVENVMRDLIFGKLYMVIETEIDYSGIHSNHFYRIKYYKCYEFWFPYISFDRSMRKIYNLR